MSVRLDGFDEWLATLDRAADPANVVSEGRKVVEKGCFNIKRDWRRRWSGLDHAPALPRAVTYDVTGSGPVVVGEVGPDKDKRQGALGNLIEYGSINNAPIPGGLPALQAEEPKYITALEKLAAHLVEGG